MSAKKISPFCNVRPHAHKCIAVKLLTFLIIVLVAWSALAHASEEIIDCDNAKSTVEINLCASIDLDAARSELKRYLDASYEHNKQDPELIKAVAEAQTSWATYVEAHCDSVYTQWRDGTIRTVMALSCDINLTKQRTHEVWETFLTSMDGAPPVLPEPRR